MGSLARRLALVLGLAAFASTPALAQDNPLGSCAVPDSIAVRGHSALTDTPWSRNSAAMSSTQSDMPYFAIV